MSHESDRDPTAETFPDPVFVHSKRESIELLVAFLVFLIWSVGVSYVLGYGVEVGANETVWGIPHWVFWGVAVPWVGATLYTVYFCTFRMADDPLEDLSDLSASTTPDKDVS